jgi:hypothetical protein
LALKEDLQQRWLVCEDCATTMLHKRTLAGLWKQVAEVVFASASRDVIHRRDGSSRRGPGKRLVRNRDSQAFALVNGNGAAARSRHGRCRTSVQGR